MEPKGGMCSYAKNISKRAKHAIDMLRVTHAAFRRARVYMFRLRLHM